MERYYFTLLSVEEYNKHRNIIPLIEKEWWLRSSRDCFYNACIVDHDGNVNDYYYVDDTYIGVRPALLISNPESVYQKGSEISRGKRKWTVLQSDNKICYALCTEIVAYRQFDAKTNIFEHSDIKQWLDKMLPHLVFEEKQGCEFDKKIANQKIADYLACCSDEDFFEVFEIFAKKVGKDIGELDDFISWLNGTLKEIHLSWLEKEAMGKGDSNNEAP